MTSAFSFLQAQQNDDAGWVWFQTMYRIFINIFRKLIFRWFWTYFKILSRTILSQEKPA
jgi:hypothetical protein